jgi:hypothetical protein
VKVLLPVVACLFALVGPHATAADDLKAGWSEAELSAFASGCVMAIMIPAKKDFEARAAQAGKPAAFPEEALRKSVEPMCSCLGRRIAESWSFAEFSKNSQALAERFVTEAMTGGRCKPEGLLGDVLEKAQAK